MGSDMTTQRGAAPSSRSARLRWTTPSELLRLIHREPGITRRHAGERLGLSSGALTETVERLRTAGLLTERRAAVAGRGRPTTILGPHEHGPLVIVVELRARHWAVSLGDLAGDTTALAAGAYGTDAPEAVLAEIARQVGSAFSAAPDRVRAVVAVVAGTVVDTRLAQLTARGWADLDLTLLAADIPATANVTVLAGNDATLGGVAEAWTGAARGSTVALHLLVTEGLGGVLLVDGQPVRGARGRGGEFGHLPFGDPALECPCGAFGCWGRTVDGEALARLAGAPRPTDPELYAREALRALTDTAPSADGTQAAAEDVARALGAGIAGLVNAHDPDVVTLSGLAPLARAAAPDAFSAAYHGGLMRTFRPAPPPIHDSTHDERGPARGALSLGFDAITSPLALADWVERYGSR